MSYGTFGGKPTYRPKVKYSFDKSGKIKGLKTIRVKRRKVTRNTVVNSTQKSFKSDKGGLGISSNPIMEFKKLTTNSIFPFPNKWVMNLAYGVNETVNILANDGGLWRGNQFNLTSLYDPDVTNSGRNGQPYGFDEVKQFYKRYVVIRASYDLEFADPTYENGIWADAMHVQVALRNEGDTYGYMNGRSLDYALERSGNSVKRIPSDKRCVRFKGTVDNAKLQGASSFDNFLENSSAPIGNSPLNPFNNYMELNMLDPNNKNINKACRVVGVLRFKVMFYEPIGVGQS